MAFRRVFFAAALAMLFAVCPARAMVTPGSHAAKITHRVEPPKIVEHDGPIAPSDTQLRHLPAPGETPPAIRSEASLKYSVGRLPKAASADRLPGQAKDSAHPSRHGFPSQRVAARAFAAACQTRPRWPLTGLSPPLVV